MIASTMHWRSAHRRTHNLWVDLLQLRACLFYDPLSHASNFIARPFLRVDQPVGMRSFGSRTWRRKLQEPAFDNLSFLVTNLENTFRAATGVE